MRAKRTGKSRFLAISLAAVFIILSSSSGSIVRNCLDRSSLTGVHGKSKRPSRDVGLVSLSLSSKSNIAERPGDSGKLGTRARPSAASKSDNEWRISTGNKKGFIYTPGGTFVCLVSVCLVFCLFIGKDFYPWGKVNCMGLHTDTFRLSLMAGLVAKGIRKV